MIKILAMHQDNFHEKNYPTHDLELGAVVFVLKMWRHYLYGLHVYVYTDDMSLQYVFTHSNLKLRQRRLLELPKDYNMSVYYQQSKHNVVAYTLSRLTINNISHIDDEKKELVKDLHQLARLCVRLKDSPNGGFSVHSSSESSFIVDVKANQHVDTLIMEVKDMVFSKLNESFSLSRHGVLRYHNRLCLPYVNYSRSSILEKTHGSRYSINHGATKMYQSHKEVYWWDVMNRYISYFVEECLNHEHVRDDIRSRFSYYLTY